MRASRARSYDGKRDRVYDRGSIRGYRAAVKNHSAQEKPRIAFATYAADTFIKQERGRSDENPLDKTKTACYLKDNFVEGLGMNTLRTSSVQIAIIGGIIIPYHIGAG